MEYISLILLILSAATYYVIFQKAGEDGWKSFVPFYNAYIIGKISGSKMLGIIWVIVILILVFCLIVVFTKMVDIANNLIATNPTFSYEELIGKMKESVSSEISMIILLIFINYIVFCISNVMLSACFNQGLMFKILICVPYVNFIMLAILAFSKNYIYYSDEGEIVEES